MGWLSRLGFGHLGARSTGLSQENNQCNISPQNLPLTTQTIKTGDCSGSSVLSIATNGILSYGRSIVTATRGFIGVCIDAITGNNSVTLDTPNIAIDPQSIEAYTPNHSEIVSTNIPLVPQSLEVLVSNESQVSSVNIPLGTTDPTVLVSELVNIDTVSIPIDTNNPIALTSSNVWIPEGPNIPLEPVSIEAISPEWVIVPRSYNIALTPQPIEVFVANKADIDTPNIPLGTEDLTVFSSDYQQSDVDSPNIPLTLGPIAATINEVAIIPVTNIPLVPKDLVVIGTNESKIDVVNIPITSNSIESLEGELVQLTSPNIPLQTLTPIAYTLPVGQSLYREIFKFTLKVKRRINYTLNR